MYWRQDFRDGKIQIGGAGKGADWLKTAEKERAATP
jgi:hypothetical protein